MQTQTKLTAAWKIVQLTKDGNAVVNLLNVNLFAEMVFSLAMKNYQGTVMMEIKYQMMVVKTIAWWQKIAYVMVNHQNVKKHVEMVNMNQD